MSPREPRTSHAISLSPCDRPGHGAHFPNGDTKVTGAAQVPRHSAHRPGAQPPLSTHHGTPGEEAAPYALRPARPAWRPLPCLSPHLVVVGLTVGQALLLIVPVPQERLLTLGADEVLGRGRGAAMAESGQQPRPQETAQRLMGLGARGTHRRAVGPTPP